MRLYEPFSKVIVFSLCSWLSGNTSIHISLALLKITLRLCEYELGTFEASIHTTQMLLLPPTTKNKQDISDNYKKYGISKDLSLKNTQTQLH